MARVPLLTRSQSRARIRKLRAAGCQVQIVSVGGDEVALKKCPPGRQPNLIPVAGKERDRRLREIQKEARRLEGWLARQQESRVGPVGAVDEERRRVSRIAAAEQRLALLRSEEASLAGQPFRRRNPMTQMWSSYCG